MIRVFTYLMRETIYRKFSFPGGAVALRTVNNCLKCLEGHYGAVGRERVIEFCICQVHAISRFDKDYISRWNVSHSFGNKAIQRYTDKKRKGYFEDCWLKDNGLTRKQIIDMFEDRSLHPLFEFIYPQYEDRTKKRKLNSTVGFYICQISTLLWTPFSPVCIICQHSEACKELTRKKYGELFRIRLEEFSEGGSHGSK